MFDWVESITSLFTSEIDCYKRLLEIEGKKRQAIHTADGKSLESHVKESYHIMVEASELERIAWDKTYKMIDFVKPIVVMMIDMSETISHMDLKIIGEMIQHNVPIVVALSKSDLVTNMKEKKQKMDMVVAFMSMAKWIPIVTLSGETGE